MPRKHGRFWKDTIYLRKDQWDFLERIKFLDPEVTTLSHALRLVVDNQMEEDEFPLPNLCDVCRKTCWQRDIYDCDDFEENKILNFPVVMT